MKLTITNNGRNAQGYTVFTCIKHGRLCSYRCEGYTAREARAMARQYFANLKS